MEAEGQSAEPKHRMFCMIVGNYGGHMAFAIDPPFCTAYSLGFVCKDDPALLSFRNQQNHPVSFTGDGLLVCQLLVWDCPEHEHAMATFNGCLLIPRGMQFPKDLFLVISILYNHAVSYHDPKTGEEAPFMTMGPFAMRDTLFWGITRELEQYTAEEVITLRNVGIFKSSSSGSKSLPKLPSLTSLGQVLSSPTSPKVIPHSPKIEPDSSSKKRDHTSSSKSHKHPVSVAAGSSTALENSEWDHDAEHRWRERSRECEDHAQSKSRSSHHEPAPGNEHSRVSKHKRSSEPCSSLEHPHSKGWQVSKSQQITWPWLQTLTLTRVHSPSATSKLPLYSHKLTTVHPQIHLVVSGHLIWVGGLFLQTVVVSI